MLNLRRRRAGFTLIELLVVCIIIGLMGAVGVRNFRGMQDNSSNAQVASNVQTVRMALEKYMAENDRLPSAAPPAAGLYGADVFNANPLLSSRFLIATGEDRRYLEGNRLPKNPWGPGNQADDIPYPGAPFVTATQAIAGVSVPNSQNVNLAIGRIPPMPAAGNWRSFYAAGGPFFGAIYYSVNRPGNDVYVVVGLGKRARNAIIASAVTNGN